MTTKNKKKVSKGLMEQLVDERASKRQGGKMVSLKQALLDIDMTALEIESKIVLKKSEFDKILSLITELGEPTEELKRLMKAVKRFEKEKKLGKGRGPKR